MRHIQENKDLQRGNILMILEDKQEAVVEVDE